MKIATEFLRGADALPDGGGAREIIAALAAAGEEARFVGGCVRDAVIGRAAGDIDLATTALPEKVLEVLARGGFNAKPLGHAHGVTFAWRDGRKYEVATLREDVLSDGRHAIVAFTRDWELDARRRDFTINALSADADGNVFDYVGGLEDLRVRRVRFIGDAAARVCEDYLRILRYYRFHARFGADWDADARRACRLARAGLAQLSRERVTEELCKLLSLENPLIACAAMTEDLTHPTCHPWDGDAVAGPEDPRRNNPNVSESENMEERNRGSSGSSLTLGPKDDTSSMDYLMSVTDLKDLIAREKIYGRQNWLLRLAAWGGLGRRFDEAFLDQFIFTRTDRADIKNFATLDFARFNHALYHHGVPAVRAAALLRAGDAELPQLIADIENFTPREFPLQAEDLLQMGVMPGPRLGEILRAVESWWLENNCTPDAAGCKIYADAMIS